MVGGDAAAGCRGPLEGTVAKVGGPAVGESAVAGAVGADVVDLLAAGPAERDFVELAGLPGQGCSPGEALECADLGLAVADLSEQSGHSQPASSRQTGADLGVGVQGKVAFDLLGDGLDLYDTRGQDRAGRRPVSFLGARSSGEAPLSGAVGARAWLLVRSLIGDGRRSALSRARTTRAITGPRRSHGGHRSRRASRAINFRRLGCPTAPSRNSNTMKLNQ